jgi:alkanesulfonate monooxygenase SsuD/methylene tetrahydromethanopterin reductase-like flavin-dependent oxidoreductase (luciferase family)
MYFGDLSKHDLDGSVPEPPDDAPMKSIATNMFNLAKREGLSIRDLYKVAAAGSTGWYLVGTPKELVDILEQWFTQGAADGFNICPAILPTGLDDFVELVLPEIRARGLFRTEYEGVTLRENLGLPAPTIGDIRARAAVG